MDPADKLEALKARELAAEVHSARMSQSGVEPVLAASADQRGRDIAEREFRGEATGGTIDREPVFMDGPVPIRYGYAIPSLSAPSSEPITAPAPAQIPLSEPVDTAALQNRAQQTQADAFAQLQGQGGGNVPLQAPTVGAGKVALDPRYMTGVEQQQAALQQLGAEYARMEPQAQELEKAYLTESQRYQKALQDLKGKQTGMAQARAAERGIEAGQLESARMGFDANRVYADLARSPLQTGALAAMAGIVQGLQGYAGEDKPNVILKSIEDAARRDVTNQVEQYKRMVQGQEFTRNAFTEARQSLADEQQALQVATMATLDQYAKGIDFIKARMSRAKDRAELDRVKGQLTTAVGEAQTAINKENVSNALKASMANQDAQTKLMEIQQRADTARATFGAQAMERASKVVTDWSLKPDQGQAMISDLQQIGRVGDTIMQAVRSGRDINEILDKSTLDRFREQLVKASAESKNSGVVARVFEEGVARIIENADPVKAGVLREVQNLFVSHLRQQAGKAQSVQETANQLAAAGLSSPKGIQDFINRKLSDNKNFLDTQVRSAQLSGDAPLAAAWNNMLGQNIIVANLPFDQLRESQRQRESLIREAAAARGGR